MMQLTRKANSVALIALLTACGGGSGGGGGNEVGAPTGLSYGDSNPTYLVQVDVEANLPTVTGQVSTWSIAPGLPQGLGFDVSSGAITGKPLKESGVTTYVVTAAGPGGQTQTTIAIEVVLPARFAYAAGADDAIGIYTVDAYTGSLRFHGLHHHEAPDDVAEQVAVHPSGRFVYVPNLGDPAAASTITGYSVDAGDGTLNLIGHTITGEGPHRIAFHPDGTHMYVLSFYEHNVYVYSIDDITGALNLEQAIVTNTGPERLAVDPQGRFLYVAHRPSADIRIFTIAPNGTLTNDVGGYNYYSFTPSDVVVDRQGAFVYFVFEVTNNLVSYKIDQATGGLTDLVEAPTTGTPRDILLHPRGDFAYVACPNTNTIDLYVLDPVTGGATRTETYTAGIRPISLDFDASGRQLYALGEDSNDLVSFAVDPATGELDQRDTVRTRAATTHFAMLRADKPALPREEFLYVANRESDDVAGFAIDVDDGTLAATGSNVLTGDSPEDVAVDPLGRFIWVANRADQSISIFSITPGTGKLVESVLPYALGATPGGLAVDPAGEHLYVSVEETDEVIGFSIAADGDLTEVDRAATETGPASVTVDPTGQFVYVSNLGGGAHTISSFTVLKGSFLTTSPAAPAPGHPGQLRFAPTGAFAYVTLESSHLVVPYAVDSTTGVLSVLASGSKTTSFEPAAITLTPDGRFAFAAVPGNASEDGVIALFSVNTDSGNLSPIGEVSEGMSPRDLAVGPTGRYLYVANEAGDDLTVFSIDPLTGNLTSLGNTAVGLAPEALILATRVD